MKAPGYCSCPVPARTVSEGRLICEICGEAVPDPLLIRILAEVRAQRRQIIELERILTDPQPGPEWLQPKEVAIRLGRSVDFVRDHADELGAIRIGDGPKPRLLFPADAVSSGVLRSDQADFPRNGSQDGEPPSSSGR